MLRVDADGGRCLSLRNSSTQYHLHRMRCCISTAEGQTICHLSYLGPWSMEQAGWREFAGADVSPGHRRRRCSRASSRETGLKTRAGASNRRRARDGTASNSVSSWTSTWLTQCPRAVGGAWMIGRRTNRPQTSGRGRYFGYVRAVGRRRNHVQLPDPIVSVPVAYKKTPLLNGPT